MKDAENIGGHFKVAVNIVRLRESVFFRRSVDGHNIACIFENCFEVLDSEKVFQFVMQLCR